MALIFGIETFGFFADMLLIIQSFLVIYVLVEIFKFLSSLTSGGDFLGAVRSGIDKVERARQGIVTDHLQRKRDHKGKKNELLKDIEKFQNKVEQEVDSIDSSADALQKESEEIKKKLASKESLNDIKQGAIDELAKDVVRLKKVNQELAQSTQEAFQSEAHEGFDPADFAPFERKYSVLINRMRKKDSQLDEVYAFAVPTYKEWILSCLDGLISKAQGGMSSEAVSESLKDLLDSIEGDLLLTEAIKDGEFKSAFEQKINDIKGFVQSHQSSEQTQSVAQEISELVEEIKTDLQNLPSNLPDNSDVETETEEIVNSVESKLNNSTSLTISDTSIFEKEYALIREDHRKIQRHWKQEITLIQTDLKNTEKIGLKDIKLYTEVLQKIDHYNNTLLGLIRKDTNSKHEESKDMLSKVWTLSGILHTDDFKNAKKTCDSLISMLNRRKKLERSIAIHIQSMESHETNLNGKFQKIDEQIKKAAQTQSEKEKLTVGLLNDAQVSLRNFGESMLNELSQLKKDFQSILDLKILYTNLSTQYKSQITEINKVFDAVHYAIKEYAKKDKTFEKHKFWGQYKQKQ